MRPKNRKESRQRRHLRVRKRVSGTASRPRMAIYVSNRNLFVQFIDDDAEMTLASASTMRDRAPCNLAAAKQLGERAAAAALDKGIRHVVIDRGGYPYHGRVREIVETALAGGLRVAEIPSAEEHERKKAVAT